MSKQTDYKRLYKQTKQHNVILNNKIHKLIQALDPAFEYLRTIITREQYVELMKRLDINVAFVDGKPEEVKDEQK